jgi:hypothetical protein
MSGTGGAKQTFGEPPVSANIGSGLLHDKFDPTANGQAPTPLVNHGLRNLT